MREQTFIRIMFDNLFVNNAICKALSALVNFCKEQSLYGSKELKFLDKMPFNKKEVVNNYQKKFIFQTTRAHEVNLR